ncbi:hypothetical protein KQI86_12850 [Clostridium sp. MSJ-11]|uniref:Uncharacterized protein n=1 Tax=Clostridium mobile TaxID=2841512 RepID=A0ABS6EJ47_9CLOT|nr:hypothetical protein [Clostridium mobile]MBU5485226.1 hypothetical protein [Clostridium mobile]
MGKKTIKKLAEEARREGLFSEAFEISKRKKVYRVKSLKDGMLIVLYFILALIFVALIRNI